MRNRSPARCASGTRGFVGALLLAVLVMSGLAPMTAQAADVDLTPGPTVVQDPSSPIGHTGHFVYRNHHRDERALRRRHQAAELGVPVGHDHLRAVRVPARADARGRRLRAVRREEAGLRSPRCTPDREPSPRFAEGGVELRALRGRWHHADDGGLPPARVRREPRRALQDDLPAARQRPGPVRLDEHGRRPRDHGQPDPGRAHRAGRRGHHEHQRPRQRRSRVPEPA